MKKTSLLLLLSTLFLAGFSTDLHAQSKKKKSSSKVDQYFDDSGKFSDNLWYGGNFNLGFSGNGSTNLFSFGLAPMVGYKITEEWSVGPRVAFDVNFYKGYGTDGRIYKTSPTSYSVGMFTRYKVFPSIFAHVEYEFENAKFPGFLNGLMYVENGEVVTFQETRDNFYVGAGYNSGYSIWGYEIIFLYNVLLPEDSVELPFFFRFGITYNF
ncbi:MAG: hypothetical protein KDC43_08635 [Saprospiraceae bacterium]|nr:hypothetical protein [Saprospiraceae bacterium]MCB0623960.1 hypothetical protein [Saprospiraceae bacterium]MCB0678999.1 hypothetical protein [Saprospiraceae bacterium]MCB0683235.1 hypothetical protein [Saprospiraceae bacterium]